MGSLILCHSKKARQPYEITRIHKKIYTLEELCYYICNNLYLIDYTLVNRQLCDWIMEELSMEELAGKLIDSLQKHGSKEQFVLTIMREASIYTSTELSRLEDVLMQLRNLKEVERQKYKADNLLQSGETEAAILGYLSILHGDRDETLDSRFYGKVYGCLGAAYGKLFLYEEAAKNYEAAFQICEEESMLCAYVYCCSHYMTEKQYRVMLAKSDVYRRIDAFLKEQIRDAGEEVQNSGQKRGIAEYRKIYRKE